MLPEYEMDLTSVLLVVSISFVGAYTYTTFASGIKGDLRELGGIPILRAWPFFTRRHDFLTSNFTRAGGNLFSFKVLQHTVTAIRGEVARKGYFDNKALNLPEGYKILSGAAPRLADMDENAQPPEAVAWFNKQLLNLMNKERLTDIIPTMLDDLQVEVDAWGNAGTMDPFENIYDLVFHMTVRMASCRELARDRGALKRLQADYWNLERSATPTALLLPWFPSPARRRKEAATKSLFTTLYQYVELRKASFTPSPDAIDFLLANGMSTEHAIGFILSVIFASVVNTGNAVCWLLLFLSLNKSWKERVVSELDAFILRHSSLSASESLHKRLATIPLSAWEDDLPTLDLVIRETIRIVLNIATLRRNVLGDLNLDGKVIPKGNFMTYTIADVHLDPRIYSDPMTFDPDRFGEGRQEDQKQAYAYLGWGAGRHVCTGMRVAKLEIKFIAALLLRGFTYEAVDKEGQALQKQPIPNYNLIHQARPLGEPFFFKFEKMKVD